MNINIDEKIDIVPGTDYRVIQNRKRFSYGTDAIFLSDFARAKGVVVDLGTGTGIIPLRLLGLNPKIEKIYGVEIQEEVAEMAQRTIELNKIDNFQVLNMDLKDLSSTFKKSTVDTVVTNPPYMKKGGAVVNPNDNFAISRHEIHCELRDIIEVSDYLLRPGGKFYMVHRPDRLVDIICLMREFKIEPKRIKFVQPKLNKKPNLILVEGSKHSRPDLKIDDPLIIYREDGSYTDELLKVYYEDKEY